MPRRKPKPSSAYSKARTHELADGWTQVIRGPPPRTPGLSTPHPVAPDPGTTLETLRAAYARVESTTRGTAFRVAMEGLLRERVVEAFEVGRTGKEGKAEANAEGEEKGNGEEEVGKNCVRVLSEGLEGVSLNEDGGGERPRPPFSNIVLLALGSPSHPSREISRVSLVQLAAANAWLSLFLACRLLPADAPRLVQDPSFNALDKRFLAEQGWTVLKSPSGEEAVGEGEGTVLLAPHLEEEVLKGILEKWNEHHKLRRGRGVMVGNDLGMVGERLGGGRAEHDEERRSRWWEGWERVRPEGARDPVGAREWFGVSLHWRRSEGKSTF